MTPSLPSADFPAHRQSERGLTIVEVSVSMAIFTVLMLSVGMTLVSGIQHRRQTYQDYRAMSVLRDMVAEIQEVANLPNDLTQSTGVGSIYQRYHNQSFSVPVLPSGSITVLCYANEATVPAQLGGPQDLNLDGDAADNLNSVAAGPDLRIVPILLTLTYQDEERNDRLSSLYRLVTQTAE